MAKKKSDAEAAPEADNISALTLDLGEPGPAPEPEVTDDPVAEVVETPVVGADEPSIVPNVASEMRAWGYEIADDATPDDIRAHLEELEDRASKYEQAQQRLAQLEAQRAEWEQRRQEPAPAPKAPEPAAATDDDLGIPERPQLDRLTQTVLVAAKQAGKLNDVGGVLTSDDPGLQHYVQVYNKHAQDIDAYDREWGDPRKVARLIADKAIAKERAEREALRREIEDWKSQQQQDAVTKTIEGYYLENKAAYFDLDAQGNIVRDVQGVPQGKRYAEAMQAAQEAMDLGITDPLNIHKYVVKHVPAVAPPPAAPPETPAKKTVKFNNRLKNNGHAASLNTVPVNRPSASPGARDTSKLTVHQQLSSLLPDLMAQKVADRM